jgi:hypothetical protein
MNVTQQTQRDGISTTKTVTRRADDTTAVSLTLRSTRDDTVLARLADPVPAPHSLSDPSSVGQVDGTTYSDGRVVFEQRLDPDESVTAGYLLAGPVEDLPDATLERVTTLDASADTIRETVVQWERADGSTAPLTLSVPDEGGSDDRPLVRLDASGPSALPAIGVVLTERNEDAVYRTVMRAKRRGHPVFLTYQPALAGSELVETVDSLGATVVVPASDDATIPTLHRALSTAARERGLPGIVLQTRDCPRIDYERTLTAFEDADFEVVAIPEAWSDPGTGPSVVVAIPAYNAAGSIGRVVERAAAFADEVVVVDDGSRDQTGPLAREAGATVVTHKRNRGYGGALKTAFREAANRNATHLVVIDADGQHDPADIPILVAAQEQADADIVIGSRYVPGSKTRIPFVRAIGLAVINHMTNVSLGNLRPSGWIRDTQSGYRVYNSDAIESLAADDSIGENMGASTDILYHAHRHRLSVTEVPTTISYDVEESSTQGSLSHGLDLVRNIVWTIEYGRPLLIVGLPGAVSMILGVLVTSLLTTQFLQGEQVTAVPLATGVLFALGGLLLCFAAILMHVLNKHPTFRQFRS